MTAEDENRGEGGDSELSQSKPQVRRGKGRSLKTIALDLLSRRDHSWHELEGKLRERGGDEGEVRSLLGQLKAIGILDDRRFAQHYVSYRLKKPWGEERYRQELLARGVDRELIDEVVDELIRPQQNRKLQGMIDRELDRGRTAGKVLASYLRRGFRYGELRSAITNYERDHIAWSE